MISFKESMQLLESLNIEPKETTLLPLMQAQGYVLADDIIADYNSPELPTAAMDGYALKFDDQSMKELKIQAINPAGAKEVEELVAGKCIKTFTGSIMPKGSDTLIPIENVSVKDGAIHIEKDVPFGFSVRQIGENFKKGEVLIKKGTVLDFSEIGVLASLNIEKVKVYKKPIVSVIATGEELLELGEEQTRASQIRSSNNYTIEAIIKKYGGEAKNLGCHGDDIESLKKLFKDALNSSDIIVSTGGVSVGDFDFVKDIVKDELDAKVVFKGVVIKPGQHIMLATVGNKTILALPGFAYSSTVTALVYLLPLIAKYQNMDYKPIILKGKLKTQYIKKSKKTEFAPCNIHIDNGFIEVDFKGKKDGTSAIMTNMIGVSALAVTSPEDSNLNAGEYIDLFIFNLNSIKRGWYE